MKLIKYGVTIRRITEDDIELLRKWRNSRKIKERMEYREHITSEMQAKWFKKIDNLDHFYYMIEYEGKKIGIINENKIGYEGKGITESGMFIYDDDYKNSFVPVLVSLILLEVNFYLRNGNESYIRVLRDNKPAISYNTTLGYVLCQGQEYVENQKYVLTRENFEKKSKALRKAALRLSGNDNKLYWVIEKVDYDKGFGEYFEKSAETFDIPKKVNIDEEKDEKTYYVDFNDLGLGVE